MAEIIESPKGEAPEKAADALIVKMVQDKLLDKENKDLLNWDRTPDNKITRYGMATVQGLGYLPQGLKNSVVHNITHPLDAATTFGMGAGMAFVLKTVLPEGGLAGKLAAAGIGIYFTAEAAKPMYHAYQKAGNALSMKDLDQASREIGNAGGAFIVDTGIAAAGFKVGGHYTGRLLASKSMDGFADMKANFYEGLSKQYGTVRETVGMGKGAEPGPKIFEAVNHDALRFLPSDRKPAQGFVKGHVDANAEMDVAIILKSKASDLKFNRTLTRIAEGKQSPLTDAQILEQFGSTDQSLKAVTQFAKDNGLTVTEANLTSGRVVIRGKTSQFTDAFQTRLTEFEGPGGEIFRAREGSLTVPKSIAPHIIGILGTDNRPAAKSYIVQFAGPEPPPLPQDAPGGPTQPRARSGYMPNQVADAYNFPKDSMGQGQSVAIIQLGGGLQVADNARYYRDHALKQPKLNIIEVGEAKNSPGQPADSEVHLDSQVIGVVAPEANQNIIFSTNSEKGFVDAILRAAFPERGESPNSAISISWGLAEEGWTKQGITAMNQAFKKAALKGISIFAAAGDDGALNNGRNGRLQTDYPAADPFVTGAGGTRLNLDGSGKIKTEVVWNNRRPNDSGGGGVSEVFEVPEFQKDVGVPLHASTNKPGRGVPDVTGNADPVTGYIIRVNGSEIVTGGTSAVSPLYSALMMRINGSLGRPLGVPLNAWLYEHKGKGFFNDIIVGDNNGYNAGKGWDATSGLGSIDGSKMLAAIKKQPFLKSPSLGNFQYLGPAQFSPSYDNRLGSK